MDFTNSIRTLTLHKPIIKQSNECIFMYKSNIVPKKLEPPAFFITFETKIERIERGIYFFIQFENNDKKEDMLQKAAEHIWLESLWKEKKISDVVFLRKLEEDSKTVFQLFWQITGHL